MLLKTLQSLPMTLDATYDRMLASINPELKDFARRLLILLCFSATPLRVCELTESLAISVDGDGGYFDFGDKMSGVHDLLTICPGMIKVEEKENVRQSALTQERDSDFSNRAILTRVKNADRRIVSLAHFSVREYLVSDRVLQYGKSCEFHLQPSLCHAWIAKICLIYLSMPGFQLPYLDLFRRDWYTGTFDFFPYASQNWADHGTRSGQELSLVPLVKKIFNSGSIHIASFSLDEDYFTHYQGCVRMAKGCILPKDRISIGIKWLAYQGTAGILEAVLAHPWDFMGIDTQTFFWKDAFDYYPSSSHQQASGIKCLAAYERRSKFYHDGAVNIATRKGNWRVVDLLLENFFRPIKNQSVVLDPLQIAARNGLDKTVALMLPEGESLDPGAYPPSSETPSSQHPILMAARNGHVSTVQTLMARGVSKRLEGRHGVTPLLIAARRGHVQLVEFLISYKLEKYEKKSTLQTSEELFRLASPTPSTLSYIDHQTDYGSTAAMRAAECGHFEVVKLLVESSADWKGLRDVDGNNVLFHAVENNQRDIVEFLTKCGVDVTLRNGKGESPEEVARRLRLDEMAEYLYSHWPTTCAARDVERISIPLVVGRTKLNRGLARSKMPWHSRVLSNDKEVPTSDHASAKSNDLFERLD
jgi:ankyrin repeat protein